MECLLRHITSYPFEFKGTDSVVLSYTCFVDGETADKLELESHGYREITNDEGEEIMLLIVRD